MGALQFYLSGRTSAGIRLKYSPPLADKYAAKAYEGIDYVAARLVEVIEPDNQYPQALLQEELSRAKPQDTQGLISR